MARSAITRPFASRIDTISVSSIGAAHLDARAAPRFRGEAPSAPYAYMGVHITRPGIVDGEPEGPFSLTPVWKRLAKDGRVHAVVFDGDWMHVGDPQARDAAEARLS